MCHHCSIIILLWYNQSNINFMHCTPRFKVKHKLSRVMHSVNQSSNLFRRQSRVDTVCVSLLDFQMQIMHDIIYQELWFVIVIRRKVVWTIWQCTKEWSFITFYTTPRDERKTKTLLWYITIITPGRNPSAFSSAIYICFLEYYPN